MRIHTEQLSFCYEGSRPAVHEISLDIPTGTLTVLCGVNGSGKSTLLRLLAGLAQPSSGQILYDHGKKTDSKTAEAVSMVFQQPETQLFAVTVHKDIEYGLMERGVSKEKRPEIIASALAKTGLAYDEFAGRSPFLLSGGEKRRVCIAGALAVEPGLLILDEPTAGLDPQAAQALLEMVQQLRSSGLTLIIGTHDLDSFLPVADKVIVMKQGAIHYDGPAPALTADPGLLADAGLTPPSMLPWDAEQCSMACWEQSRTVWRSCWQGWKSTRCLSRKQTAGTQTLATLHAVALQHPAAQVANRTLHADLAGKALIPGPNGWG